ncbi:MAG: oligosaccharyl transferase, archaeosortase A system-associated [Chloroflexi bacterium]|nr:oligosaccharyl transferase, archaeosortase A system-associated [Chloroflexota bacterium]
MGNKVRISDLVIPALLLIIAAVSLYIRIALPYNTVFSSNIIKFTGADAYYYMRLVDNIVYNFPHLTPFDPYYIYPDGGNTGVTPDLFAYLIAFVAKLLGPGNFSQQSIDTIAVYIPPVLATLVIIPLYFIGKAVFNRWVGILAAAIFVILPVEVGRSLLGYTDQHIAEVLITTILMLFIILALKNGSRLELDKPANRAWNVLCRPLIYSILAGICLGIYFLTWVGALLFVLLLFIYFLVQFTVDHILGKSVDYLGLTGCVTGAVALLMILVWRFDFVNILSLLIFALFPIIMTLLSRYFCARGWKAWWYPLTVAVIGLLSGLVVFIISPSFIKGMFGLVGFIFIPNISTTNNELQPLMFVLGRFTLDSIFESFTTAFYISLVAVCFVIYHAVKAGERNKVMLIVWSLVIVLATFAMRRFAYYYAVNAALLTGYLCWLVLHLAGFGKAKEPKPLEAERAISKKARRKQVMVKRKRKQGAPLLAYKALSIIGIIFIVFYPNFGPLPGGAKPISDMASQPSFAPSDAWCDTLTWMRKNTPEPVGNADAYYKLWERPAGGEQFKYPDTAYGVLAWWDTGYWITRIGRRIPMTNPGMGAQQENQYASFFMTENGTQAGKILEMGGGRYVIIDFDTALPLKFHSIAASSGNPKEKYYDVYYQKQNGKLTPLIFFYPEYYRTVMVRLFNFDGKAVTESNVTAISYEDKEDASGQAYKQVTDYKTFKTYSEAQAYVMQHKTGQYKIGGADPFESPISLEPLTDFKLEYGSGSTKATPAGATVPDVKVFKYK